MNSYYFSRVQAVCNYTNNCLSSTALAVILELLRKTGRSTGFSTELNRASDPRKFELREELPSYLQKTRNTEKKYYFELVCQGFIRLLRIDTSFSKEVSTQLLDTKQACGAGALFFGLYLLCRAVAVDRGSSALVVLINLGKWLQRLPSLENNFHQFVHPRQGLIFFKTKTKPGSQTSLTLQQLLFYSILTRTEFRLSSLLGVTVYQQECLCLSGARKRKCLAQNRSPIVCEAWGFAEQNPEAIARVDLFIYKFPEAYWLSIADLVKEIFWLQNQINQHHIYQPREYKYNNLAAADQPPASQIYPQIDYSQLEQKTINVIPIDSFFCFGGFGTGLNGLDKDCWDNIKQSLELSFLICFIYQILKLSLQSLQFSALIQFVNIVGAIAVTKTTRIQLYLRYRGQQDSVNILTVGNHPQYLINKLQDNKLWQTIRRWGEFQEIPTTQQSLDGVLSIALREDALLLKTRCKIQLENVSFRFHPDEAAKRLKNILFNFRAGQTIGIVGARGSAKTTITNFLTRLYHWTSGRIRISINGHDISRVYLKSLRKQSGVVPQECFLFSQTIFDNITLYNREFILKQVIVTTKLAGKYRFIQTLSFDYHTPLGKKGIILAGGKGQKIAIPRALIINPSISILNEVTSSLDADSICQSQQNLSRCVHLSLSNTDTTLNTLNTLTVTHCVSMLCNAQYIVVSSQDVLCRASYLRTINNNL